mgnify:CR=1 FL=1
MRITNRPKFLMPGFSLIEILIVLLIISIITTVAVLTFNHLGEKRSIQLAGEAFAVKLELAEERAMLEPNVYAVAIDAKGYRFVKLVTQNHQESWQEVTNNPLLKKQKWPFGTHIKLKLAASQVASNKPTKILLVMSGENTPFTLILSANKPLYLLKLQSDGQIIQHSL